MEQQKSDNNSEKVTFVSFNQDSTSLAVSTESRYSLYALSAEDGRLDRIHDQPTEDVCILERLFSSSLIAIVLASAPRRLKVSHFKRGTEICNYSYAANIVAVKLNRARLVVVLEEALYIHNIRDMKVLHTIKETASNPAGICALSPSSEHCYLAYPGSSTVGEVQIFDTYILKEKLRISAHNSMLAAMAFDPTGTKLATASEKGTVIRIFSVLDGTRLCELRRGVKRCAVIYSLAFSADSKFLAASSNTETVHVFRTDDSHESKKDTESSKGWMGYLTKAVSVSASYLPAQVAEVLNQGRSFAAAHLPFQGIRNVCALTTMQKQLRLLVAASDGLLYVYAVDASVGGECQLVARHRLNEVQDPGNSAPEQDSCPRTIYNESYAGKLKGRSSSSMTDSEKYREMIAATEFPATSALKLNDQEEFPPMTHQIN